MRKPGGLGKVPESGPKPACLCVMTYVLSVKLFTGNEVEKVGHLRSAGKIWKSQSENVDRVIANQGPHRGLPSGGESLGANNR